MEQLKKNVMKVAGSPRKFLPVLLRNLDVLLYSLVIFIILLPYVAFKKIFRRSGDF